MNTFVALDILASCLIEVTQTFVSPAAICRILAASVGRAGSNYLTALHFTIALLLSK
jgi:hypothetical protein